MRHTFRFAYQEGLELYIGNKNYFHKSVPLRSVTQFSRASGYTQSVLNFSESILVVVDPFKQLSQRLIRFRVKLHTVECMSLIQ